MTEREEIEEKLYRWRNPSPADVGARFGVSGQHIKNLCRAFGIPMLNQALPGSERPTWVIPREAFRELYEHFRGNANRPAGDLDATDRN